MLDYIMVLTATMLIAVTTGFQRLYQKNEGTSIQAGLTFNMLMGLCGSVIFFFISGFRLSFAPFSILMSVLETALCMTYLLLGFRVMQTGGMVIYSMFLMTGGMMVPYVWGLLFLGEPFTVLHTLGLFMILFSIILYNSGSGKPSGKLLAMCVLVFILNGFVSVISKLHQIETVRATVPAGEFVLLANLAKFALSLIVLLILRPKGNAASSKPSMKSLIPILFASAADGIGYWLQLKGAASLPATVLYPIITGGAILFSALLGMIFFRERPSLRGWLGIALCIAGLCMMI